MKTIIRPIVFITLLFLAVAAVSYVVVRDHFKREDGMRAVVMNRIASEVEDNLKDEHSDGILSRDKLPELEDFRNEFGKKAVPDRIEIISIDNVPRRIEAPAAYIQPIEGKSQDSGNTLKGFLHFIYSSDDRAFTLEMAGVILFISYFAVIAVILIGYRTMIKPFNSLSDYPEKIAKGRMTDGIPETKQKMFGKYVWGMNMLKDEMNHKQKVLNTLEKEKQTLIVSIAHGIKTPLSNIKLYAEAIEQGIYHKETKPNEKDVETARKIEQNVEKVEVLVKEIMDKSTQHNSTYEPTIDSFYLKDLVDMVKKEYTSRIELLHIPFEIKCENNPLVTSDKDGIYTIISQLLENAIKYGSGQGITVTMGSQDEDVYITVKNKGNVLSEEETAYVFKSFWRGSNSRNVEGQGIGLYVAKKMAEALSGDIFMKTWESEEITEVTLIIPLN